MAILAVAMGLMVYHRYVSPISRFKVWYWMMAIPGVFFSLLPSSYKSDNTIAISIYMIIAGIFVVLARVDLREGKRVLKIIEISSVVFSVYIIAVKIFPALYWNGIARFISSYSRESAAELAKQGYGIPIGDSITFADYVIAMAVLGRISRVLFSKMKMTASFFVQMGLNLVAMFFENRRSEILCLALTVFVVFLLSLDAKHLLEFLRRVLWFVAIAAVIVLVVVILYRNGQLGRYEGLIRKVFLKDTSGADVSGGRLELWAIAWGLFLKNPFLGIGWERFMAYNTYHHDVHNTYLQWLCETGIIGFTLIFVPTLVLLLMSLRRAKKLIADRSANATVVAMAVVGFGIQFFFFAVNVIDPAYYHLNYFCFFGIAIILSEYSYRLYAELLPGE
ncbi:MAG: O-antigen ligase family protein [Lachnospiraceae bacterium]|nr:O-antigen ligase family protein [Lachnospiraceae bacterium]